MQPRRRFFPVLSDLRVRALLLRISPFVLVVAGIALAVIALTSEVEVVGQEAMEGTAPPGDTPRGVNRADYGAIVLESEVLPCPVLVYPLTLREYGIYMQEGTLPDRTLDCDNPSVALDRQVSHLIFRNVDPIDSLDYRLTLTFFRTTRPLTWVALPALGLLSAGSVIVVVRLLLGGLEKATKPPKQEMGNKRSRETARPLSPAPGCG